MKHFCAIGTLLMIAVLAACDSSVRESKERPCRELEEIDSLLWTQPDSALTRLIQCYDTVSDRHYANLLLAELLYKNDYEQTNRSELLEAVAYYDSVFDPFLSARAHYINGVGYYERDSVVLACKEYLKAVETMEEHFTEKELVGKSAKFMALAYTHICELFSDQYLHEQAIYFGKQSLPYYNRHNAEPWHIAWMLDEIGSHYDMMGGYDTAEYYYHGALAILPDTNNITYRMVSGHLAFLMYEKTKNREPSLKQLYLLQGLSESENEYYSRCLTIGGIYFYEAIYDSAQIYLTKVFNGSPSIDSRKQAAEWLAGICKAQGENGKTQEYADFLVPFATQDESNGTLKSQLSLSYNTYIQQRQSMVNRQTGRLRMKWIGIIIGVFFVVTMVTVFLCFWNKRKNLCLNARIVKCETEQKAIGGRLKRSNETIRELKKQLRQQKEKTVSTEDISTIPFVEEPICQHILKVCKDEKQPIKSTISVSEYADIALTFEQKAMLKEAVTKHYSRLFQQLRTDYPCLKEKDLFYCYLCLLGLNTIQIAALQQLSYTSVWEREKRLQAIFNNKNSVVITLNEFLTKSM